jgi:hypothetical protein
MKQHHNNNSTDGNVSIELQMWEKVEMPSQKSTAKEVYQNPLTVERVKEMLK